MGYNTDFTGQVTIVPPLNPYEVEYLDRFAETRHSHRERGPYAVWVGEVTVDDSYEPDRPPPELPGYHCKWVPTAAGEALTWNGEEKFYYADRWLAFLIGAFLKPGAVVRGELDDPVPGRFYPAVFEHFTFDHVLNGTVSAEGEEPDDLWRIEVRDNVVHVVRWVTRPNHSDIDPAEPGSWAPERWEEFEARSLYDHVFVIDASGERDVGTAAENGFEPVEAPRY
ncbi:hypothetical protein [Actinoplanes sp. NPDC049802]|uniref:hypothetical protein n=1 Tax=Actinoplanes sp. NPDC049802 TaxID=3154742 RepID=UPI0033C6A42A